MIAVLVLANLLVSSVSRRAAPTRAYRDVVTTQGVVRGYLTLRPPHYEFLGVPYARPPSHYDRFKAPQPQLPWDGIFEATHHVKCPQPDGEGDENCLVINVFAPQYAEALPVLVFVHDGAFQYGWGSFKPPIRLLEQHLLVVTFNYRVSALGFLCMGSREIPGNAGLKDQVAALYWIQRNIANFGGDPREVTVHGIGSGAAALELILLSGLGTGLLHKVILESGTALSPLSITYEPLSDAMAAAKTLCEEDTKDVEKLTRFYKKASALELGNTGKMFLPCVEMNSSRGLLEMEPIDILQTGIYQKVPMLIVFTNTEDKEITEVENNTLNNILERFDHLLPNNLEFPDSSTKHKVAGLVKKFYFSDNRWKENLARNYVEYMHDVTMEYPIMKAASLHAATSLSPVYLMKVTYETELRNKNDNMVTDSKIDRFLYCSTKEINDVDRLIADRLVAIWSNFIKTGDPTPITTALIPVVWQPIAVGMWDHNQMNIADLNGLEFGVTIIISDSLTTQPVKFWDNIYQKFRKRHNQTNDQQINKI